MPVTIKNLIADDVKIRILGDFAIIHGRTSYTTADGQQAHGALYRLLGEAERQVAGGVGACGAVKHPRRPASPGPIPGIRSAAADSRRQGMGPGVQARA